MISYVVSGLAPDMIPSVAELERKCFSAPVSEEGLRSLYVGGIGKGFVCIEPDNRTVLAYGGVMCAADEAQVLNIATCPEYRRNGLARAILSAILEHSEENGAEFITLEVRESNIPAISLYKKNGFEEDGMRKNFYSSPSENAILMTKRKN
jgi:ribosomal-protein-alanine N-acetyltransferase